MVVDTMLTTFIEYLFLAQSSEVISIDFFKWACGGLVLAIIGLAKSYQNLDKLKDEEIAKINSQLIDCKDGQDVSIAKLHKDYQDKIDGIVKRKDNTIEMIRNLHQRSEADAFEKITKLLTQQTDLALANQKYVDKMISIMKETTGALDDIEPLLEVLEEIFARHDDMNRSLDKLNKLKHELKDGSNE